VKNVKNRLESNSTEKGNNILFLSPHTDDVELGSGGTLEKFRENGNNIMIIVFSEGSIYNSDDGGKSTLKKEFKRTMKEAMIQNYKILNFKIRELGYSRQEILEELVKVNDSFFPDLVVGPSLNDFHQDHQTIASEMVRAFKTEASIICYEMPWNHISFNTQLFVRLEKKHIERKLSLLNHYKSQLKMKRPYFSSEFIYGLAKTRGVQCNSEYAEAFEVLRWIM
jgi:LmbE family N-acetylglucosaminyl deacetylase